jgi:hypothetical protein
LLFALHTLLKVPGEQPATPPFILLSKAQHGADADPEQNGKFVLQVNSHPDGRLPLKANPSAAKNKII